MLNIKNLLEHVITKALNTRVYNYFFIRTIEYSPLLNTPQCETSDRKPRLSKESKCDQTKTPLFPVMNIKISPTSLISY